VSAYLTNARTTEELIETVAAVTRGENLIPLTKCPAYTGCERLRGHPGLL
jgi:hypothetical protein